MDMGGIQGGQVGMALFDMWNASVQKTQKSHKAKGSALVAAAAEAFESYIGQAETGMAAQISGVAAYALNPGGNSASPVTGSQIAPFLALNAIA